MKLVKFIGKGIRGYLNHEINFRDSVTFLIGINGSGKTSVLKLINGLTQPSYKILESIDYSQIELHLIHDSNNYILRSEKLKDTISISINRLEKGSESSTIVRVKPDNRGFIDPEDMDNCCMRFSHLPASHAIAELSSPIFIGIERMPEEDILRYIQRTHRFQYYTDQNYKSTIDGSLSALQEVVFDIYRKNGTKQKIYSEEFRSAILKEALGLITSKNHLNNRPINNDFDLTKFNNRKEQFVQALRYAGLEDPETMTEDFFTLQKENFDILSGKILANEERRTKAIIDLYVCKAQMDKIDSIISHEIKYEEKISKLNEQFRRFVDCANLFFKESGKELKILDNGLIKVNTTFQMEDGRKRSHMDSITSLSSGEKQIVALIGSLIFRSSSVRQEVIVIDEPELSLHLTWQEIFVDAILKAQPNFQFILATHSPTIIAKISRRDWCEDLSKKMK